jgi:hypothetical protein
MAVSTSTASRLPKISVEEIGDHCVSLAPGGRSLVTTVIWALTKLPTAIDWSSILLATVDGCIFKTLAALNFPALHRRRSDVGSTCRFRQKGLYFLVEIPCDRERVGIPIGSQQTDHPVVGDVDAVRAFVDEYRDRSIGPASGTCLAICCMMSGLPMMSRAIRGSSSPVAFLMTEPWSSSMKSIRPLLPSTSRTVLSNCGNVRAAAVVFANTTMSGWPTAALIAANILSNGRDEVRLNRSTSTVVIIATRLSFPYRRACRERRANFSRSRRRVAARVPVRFLCGAGLRATSVLSQTK